MRQLRLSETGRATVLIVALTACGSSGGADPKRAAAGGAANSALRLAEAPDHKVLYSANLTAGLWRGLIP